MQPRLDEMDKHDGNINNGEHDTLATWLIARKTGAGETTFTRIHEASNGLVELLSPKTTRR
jgi:hypothetical protein